MLLKKKRVLFVGSFKQTSKDGGVGGQMFACKTIVNSELSDFIQWNLIDTTADSNSLSSNYQRVKKAVLRFIKFTYNIVFYKHEYILIFVGEGWSFWEKGLMCLVSKMITKSDVIIAPRSGFIINDLDYNKRLKGFIKYVFIKVDHVICQSNSWKTLYEELIESKYNSKFVIIENVIDFDKYKNLPVRKLQKSETVQILFMAWVAQNKGIFELIESVKVLKDNNYNFRLTVAGLGADYDSVVALVAKYKLCDCVEFKGWVLDADKIDILSTTDIFVLPTYFDGYPNSLMEAMASAKACVATKVGSIPDMIDNYESGIIIEKQNSGQLYQSLQELISDPELRFKLSTNARQTVMERNSISVGIQKYKKIFNIQ